MAQSIAGKWRGHYQYRGVPDSGSGFGAFFSETAGRIDGTVEDDFAPGEASVTGSFFFPSVQFTKVYRYPIRDYIVDKQSNQVMMYTAFADPIEYEGSMSEDGKTMRGTWTINSASGLPVTGTWTAYRLEEKEKKKEKETERKVKEPQSDELLVD